VFTSQAYNMHHICCRITIYFIWNSPVLYKEVFHTGTVFGITCLRGEALVHSDNKMLIFYLFELDLSVDIGTYANAGRLCIFLILSEGVILKNAHGDFEGTTGGRKFNITKKWLKVIQALEWI